MSTYKSSCSPTICNCNYAIACLCCVFKHFQSGRFSALTTFACPCLWLRQMIFFMCLWTWIVNSSSCSIIITVCRRRSVSCETSCETWCSSSRRSRLWHLRQRQHSRRYRMDRSLYSHPQHLVTQARRPGRRRGDSHVVSKLLVWRQC